MRLSDIQRAVLTSLVRGDRIVSEPAKHNNGTGRRYFMEFGQYTAPHHTINALNAAGYLVAFDHTITPAGRRALEPQS